MTSATTTHHGDQPDSIVPLEEGQAAPVSVLTTESQQRKSISSIARCVVAAFAIAALTGSAVDTHLGQKQRRRLESRELASDTIIIGAEDYLSSVPFIDSECPGNESPRRGYIEIPRIWALDLGDFGIDDVDNGGFERTFAVVENHTVLDNGVMFNVETVPAALPGDVAKPRLSEEEVLAAVKREATAFYGTTLTSVAKSSRSKVWFPSNNSLIEASSVLKSDENGGGTVLASGQGFLAACMMAFAHHLPLALTPDDLWLVIVNGFARHVQENAEELRGNFVDHEGKTTIRIREDRMVKGASVPEQWEEWIFPKFSAKISNATNNEDVYKTLAVDTFSTTTAASQAASEIILMSTMKSYFEFHIDTMCGIPNVRLEGTRDDWEQLRERAKSLAAWMLQGDTHGDLWINDIVIPILDEFLKSFDGEVNYCFWQNMVKFRTTGDGSGGYDFLSGWLPTLFPYLSSFDNTVVPNPHLRPWLQSAVAFNMGPKPSEIPIQLSSVPVVWTYLGEPFPLHFHAGFRGVHQEEDGTIKPIIGWYVTEDPEE